MTGMKMNHIPYRGSGQATTDLIGGQVQMSMPGMAGMLGHIRSGKLRALAVTGARRSPQLPDVPTVAEAGVPGYEAGNWIGIVAPAGTPPDIVEKLHREISALQGTPAAACNAASAGLNRSIFSVTGAWPCTWYSVCR